MYACLFRGILHASPAKAKPGVRLPDGKDKVPAPIHKISNWFEKFRQNVFFNLHTNLE